MGAAEDQTDRYVVIDGYKRIAALKQLGRDAVEAVVWPMSEAAAVLLNRSLRISKHETALEVGCFTNGAAFRLQSGRVGAAIQSQCDVGVAASGVMELHKQPYLETSLKPPPPLETGEVRERRA